MVKTSMIALTQLLLATLVGLLASSGAQANLIANPSFEAPVVPVGSFTVFGPGSLLLTDWSVTGPAGTGVAIVSGSFVQNGVAFTAADGAQWLDLTGFNSNSTEGVAQSVATNPGHTYQLSYVVGNTTGGGIFGATSTVNVSVNGAPEFTDTNAHTSAATLDWQQFTHTFVAGTPTTTLLFQNGDPAGDNSNGLDNVVLLDLGVITSPVPEPTSLLLVGAGVAGLVGRVVWTRRSRHPRRRA